MKSYEQRREAVIRVLGDVDYEQTDDIIEAFFDGDTVYVIDLDHYANGLYGTPDPIDGSQMYEGYIVPLQPKR